MELYLIYKEERIRAFVWVVGVVIVAVVAVAGGGDGVWCVLSPVVIDRQISCTIL